jgi:hypothetical protein
MDVVGGGDTHRIMKDEQFGKQLLKQGTDY